MWLKEIITLELKKHLNYLTVLGLTLLYIQFGFENVVLPYWTRIGFTCWFGLEKYSDYLEKHLYYLEKYLHYLEKYSHYLGKYSDYLEKYSHYLTGFELILYIRLGLKKHFDNLIVLGLILLNNGEGLVE